MEDLPARRASELLTTMPQLPRTDRRNGEYCQPAPRSPGSSFQVSMVFQNPCHSLTRCDPWRKAPRSFPVSAACASTGRGSPKVRSSGHGLGLQWTLVGCTVSYVCSGRHSSWPSGGGYCRLYPIRRATLHAPGETFPSNLEGLAGGVREWPARRRLHASGCAKFILVPHLRMFVWARARPDLIKGGGA